MSIKCYFMSDINKFTFDPRKFLKWQEINQYDGGLFGPEVHSSQKHHQQDKSHLAPKDI